MARSALVHSESSWSSREIFCPILQKTATIAEAHQQHSFGGRLPIDPSQLCLDLRGCEGHPYPEKSYVNFDNKESCDICGHKCLD